MLSRDLNRDSKNFLRQERFYFLTAAEFMRAPTQVRNAVGVYVILLRNAGELLINAELPIGAALAKGSLMGYQHVYTGMSTAIRSRALLHLCGTIRGSAVRENLLAIQFSHQVLWQGREMDWSDWEARLTDWLVDNAVVGFQISDEPHVIERKLIERLPSPFNTQGNKGGTVVSALTERRDQFRRHLNESGQIYQGAEPCSASQWLVAAASNHLAGWQSKQLA